MLTIFSIPQKMVQNTYKYTNVYSGGTPELIEWMYFKLCTKLGTKPINIQPQKTFLIKIKNPADLGTTGFFLGAGGQT